MRKIDESRAANYIRKHSNYKKWLAFVLCLSLLTGTVTLYILNKPATAMTAEGAEGLGVMLETASNADEETLIQQTLENKAESNEGGDDDDDLFSEFNEDGDDNDENAGGNGDGDDLNKSGDDEETKDGLVEEEVKEGELKEGELKEGEGQEEAEEEDELTQDVVLTVSYVDEDGEAIADEKEIDINDRIDLASEAPSIEGYTFKEATFKGDVITKVAVKKNADDIRYYEVTFDGDEAKEIKKDATVVLTYIKDEEEVEEEVDASVTLTAKYVDKDGEDIQDSEDISFAKETSINKDNAPEIDGYFFMKAVYDGQEIVKITPVETEAEVEAEDSDNEEETTEETEEVKTVSVEGYEFTTADGDTVEITEDAEIEYTYLKASEETEFTYADGKVTVTATINGKNVFPEGIVLKATEITTETIGYSYDAYIQAMNEKAEAIAEVDGSGEVKKYNEDNTVLYDIAFMLEGIEYQPAYGAVSISMRFNDKILSDDGENNSSEDVTVIHLPISEEIMENVVSTSEAESLTASDINVEVINTSTVSFEDDADVVEFSTDSFSAYALTIPENNSWVGTISKSARDIAASLGNILYFGAVANNYESVEGTTDIEANIAVKNLYNINEFGNTLNVYTNTENGGFWVIKHAPIKDRKFYFVLCEDKEGKNIIGGVKNNGEPNKYFVIKTTETAADGNYYGEYDLTKDSQFANDLNRSEFYVFELKESKGEVAQQGDTVKDRGKYFVVNYGSNGFKNTSDSSGNQDSFASYVENNVKNIDLWNKLKHVDGNTVFVKKSDNEYVEYTYGGSKDGVTHTGEFPISVSRMMNTAESVSKLCAQLKSNDDVTVINMTATNGGFKKDLANAIKEGLDQNALTNNGGVVIDGKLLVINMDMTGIDSYTTEQIDVTNLNHDNNQSTKKTGDGWDDIANQIIINPVVKRNGEYVPYEGKLGLNSTSGTVLAPRATVKLGGEGYGGGGTNHPGTIIANWLYQVREIHKYTLIRYIHTGGIADIYNYPLDTKAKITVNKEWIMGTSNMTSAPAPETVELTLYRKNTQGQLEVVGNPVHPDSTWKYTWSGLDYYDDNGDVIEYFVAETKVPEGFITSAGSDNPQKVYFDDGATEQIVENNKTTIVALGTATVTNTKSTTKVVVKKQWGVDNDPYSKESGFDIDIQLLRKIESDDKYTLVSDKKAVLKKGDESVTFDNLPLADENGNKYIYSAQESFNGKVFQLDGDSINGFKLKSIDTFEVKDGTGIKLTNVPVMIIEKIFTENNRELSLKEANERFPEKQICVHLYKSNEENPKLIILNAENNWSQEVEITRGYINGNEDAQQYFYYIVECNPNDKTDYQVSPIITYFKYIGDSVESSHNGADLKVMGNSSVSTCLKLQVKNELGDNVLPSTGGMGDIPYLTTGLGTAVAGLLGARVYSRKKKKDDEE